MYIQQANMKIVDNLIRSLPDWENIIDIRYVKFVYSYFRNKKNLNKVGEEFNLTCNDMLAIFWRIQKQLQAEYRKRIHLGKIEKNTILIKCEKSS